MYGLNLERRILDKMLYEVDNNESHDNYYSQFYNYFVNWYNNILQKKKVN
jgi:hypothetical protein